MSSPSSTTHTPKRPASPLVSRSATNTSSSMDSSAVEEPSPSRSPQFNLPKWTPINGPPFNYPSTFVPSVEASTIQRPYSTPNKTPLTTPSPTPSSSTTDTDQPARKADPSATVLDDEELLRLASDYTIARLSDILKTLYPGVSSSTSSVKRHIDGALTRKAAREGRSFEDVKEEFSNHKAERRRKGEKNAKR